MMPILLNQDHFTEIYEAWPPSQPATQGGDTTYWKNLPKGILKAIAAENLAVWPVIGHNAKPSFATLQSLLVADQSDDKQTLTALAMAEVWVTQPPTYIKTLLKQTGVKFTPLTPNTARDVLLVR